MSQAGSPGPTSTQFLYAHVLAFASFLLLPLPLPLSLLLPLPFFLSFPLGESASNFPWHTHDKVILIQPRLKNFLHNPGLHPISCDTQNRSQRSNQLHFASDKVEQPKPTPVR